MLVGQQKHINLCRVYNITNSEIFSFSGVSKPSIIKWLKGETVIISVHEAIVKAIEEIIKYRKSLK